MKDKLIVVCGAGGFIGGHLVADLIRQGHTRIRAVDLKPLDRWYQRFEGIENLTLDLQELGACRAAVKDAAWVYNLAADMGGMEALPDEFSPGMSAVRSTTLRSRRRERSAFNATLLLIRDAQVFRLQLPA